MVALVLMVGLVLVAIGCGPDGQRAARQSRSPEEGSVRAVVDAYFAAVRRGDGTAICRQIAARTQRRL